jgi:hypothetical protein
MELKAAEVSGWIKAVPLEKGRQWRTENAEERRQAVKKFGEGPSRN